MVLARVAIAGFSIGSAGVLAASSVLPVYIEENHAGSFYFLVQELELEREHALVLIDAHSDASAAPESDRVRSDLRRVASVEERRERLREWRRMGRIQANDWIEPLMPRPIARVYWVGETDQAAKQKEASRFVDGRLEGEPRACGSLAERFKVVGWKELAGELGDRHPVIVSLDLDTFSGMEAGFVEEELPRVIDRILSLPRLAAVTVALSRPWLVDDAEADRLLGVAVREFCAVQNAAVRFEPFASCGPDRTRLAKEAMARGKLPARFAVEECGEGLREEVLKCRERLVVRGEAARWKRLLDGWEGERAGWFLQVDGAQQSADGVVRMDRTTQAAVRVRGGTGMRVTGVRWFQRKPEHSCYNVLPEIPAGKAFSGPAGGWIRSVDLVMAETFESALAPDNWKGLAADGLGVVRLWAEVMTGAGVAMTPELEIRLTEGEGLHAGLAEQFGLPYVFGAGFLRGRGCNGPETGWGNDCANFLVYGWRRTGRSMPWCNPAQLRRHLVRLGEIRNVGGGVKLPPGSVARGVVVHLGNHVAAVWRDEEPIGVLTIADELVHHLGGFPEIVTLESLMATKDRERVEVLMMPEIEEVLTVAFGGDVNLAGLAGGEQHAVENMPEDLIEADFSMVNLECVLATKGAAAEKRYTFRAAPEGAVRLSRAGIDAVSLGNNHAGDFGVGGLQETLRSLEDARVDTTGAGTNLDDALMPVVLSKDGVRVAVMSASLVKPELLPAESDRAGVVCLPKHEPEFLEALKGQRARCDGVIVSMHWGDEYTGRVTDTQRAWARKLVDSGAVAVVGTHAHHPQMTDTWKGRPIIYSLGNLIFPGEGPNPGFRRAAVARLSFGAGGRLAGWHVTEHRKNP